MDRLEELFCQDPNLKRLIRPDPDEILGLSESIKRLREEYEANPGDPDLVFQLATVLISHARVSYVEEGVRLMHSLVYARWEEGWSKVVDSQRGPYAPSTWSAPISRGVPVVAASAPPHCSSGDDEDEEEDTVVSSLSDEEGTDTNSYVATISGRCPVPDASHSSSDRSKASRRKSSSSGVRPGSIDDMALYHYYLTLGWIKLKDMEKASSCVEQMLLLAPGNKQGLALKSYIEVAGRQEAAVDVAKVAGVTAVLAGAAAVVGLLFRPRQ